MDGKEEIESLQDRITGRFSCETICDKDIYSGIFIHFLDSPYLTRFIAASRFANS